jgi:uncharacterized membrane protein
MAPLIVLVGLFGFNRVLGALGVKPFRDWGDSLRYALAMMFLFTASAHFTHLRADLVRMVPPFFPNPDLLVTLSGIAEIAGAIGLLTRQLVTPAAFGLSLLLLCVFPANVHAAQAGLSLDGQPLPALAPRTALQLLFLAATLTCALRFRRPRPNTYGELSASTRART